MICSFSFTGLPTLFFIPQYPGGHLEPMFSEGFSNQHFVPGSLAATPHTTIESFILLQIQLKTQCSTVWDSVSKTWRLDVRRYFTLTNNLYNNWNYKLTKGSVKYYASIILYWRGTDQLSLTRLAQYSIVESRFIRLLGVRKIAR